MSPSVLPCIYAPPGLSLSDSSYESATKSRERRRVALAVKHAMSEMENVVVQRLQTLDYKIDKVLEFIGRSIVPPDAGLSDRVSRLETLFVCTQPSVDDVLDSMFRKTETERKFKTGRYATEPEAEATPSKGDRSLDFVTNIGCMKANIFEDEMAPVELHAKTVAVQTNAVPEPMKHCWHGCAARAEAVGVEELSDAHGIPEEFSSINAKADEAAARENVESSCLKIDVADGKSSDQIDASDGDKLGLTGNESSVVKYEVDDWILVNGKLASVVRVGFGHYEGQIRVLRPNEPLEKWSAGEWRPLTQVSILKRPVLSKLYAVC